jgi:WhiB family redox-sensing transcriptional regulator
MLQASPSMERTSSGENSEVLDPFDIPWHHQAACYQDGYSLFFHEGKLRVQEVARKAKSYCSSCPVKDLCLRSSLVYRDKFGIWGGLTPKERQRLLRRIDLGELTLDEAIEQVCDERAA